MVNLPQILAYTTALGIAAMIPGPGMTALVGRCLSGGAIAGLLMLLVLILGDLIYLSFSAFGIAIISTYFQSIFTIIRVAASIYLIYLAWIFWSYKPQQININATTKLKPFSIWFSGLTITLANPKTIVFYLSIVPLLISTKNLTFYNCLLILVPLTIVILLIVGGIYIFGAIKIRALLSSVCYQQVLFRAASLMMFFAAIGVIIQML